MLYCYGVAKLFVLELGPLLTALLLAGRIGGSYAGEVGPLFTFQLSGSNLLCTLVNQRCTVPNAGFRVMR